LTAGIAVLALTGLGGAVALAGQAGSVAAAEQLLSRDRPVTASSNGGCCLAKNAVDGSLSTRWASAANKDPSWIYVDLGQTANVTHVRLTWDLSCAVAYRVETSLDHATWTPIFTTSTGDGGVDDLTGVSGSGRYVRVYGTRRCRADATHGYSLKEFEVFGNGDSVPPTAPGTPVPDAVTPTTVTVHWSPSTDNIGVAFYDIYKDGQLCGTVTAPATSGTCSGLSPDFDFGIYVNARDAAGNVSDPSPKIIVHTPKGEVLPPSAPTNVHTTSVTSVSVGLAWTASTDNVGVAVYTVYDVTSGSRVRVGSSGDATPSARVEGLTPDTDYRFVVTASDVNKNESDPSAPPLLVHTPPGGCTGQPICTVTTVGTDNDVVWGLVTLPDGSLLYNRRDAHNIGRLVPSTGAKSIVGTVPNVQSTNGEGGLTGLEISPTFSTDHWLYLMHTSPTDNRIVRIRYNPATATIDTSTEQVLLTGIKRNTFHNGGRLRFGPDGKLYASTGDAQSGANAQNVNSLNGKVLRLNPDGTVPSDNPFHNYAWSYGHRNPQGIAFDSQGRLWEQEFGNSIMDETNLIVKGGNYGWPSCEGTSGTCGTAGFIKPVHTYPVGSGSCSGLTVIRDVIYIACERGQRLYREVISGTGVTNVQQFFVGTYGRLRTVEPAPDGGMWLATSNGGDKDSTPNNSSNKIFHVALG
jgi:glucose/arabinose dehydrogenase